MSKELTIEREDVLSLLVGGEMPGKYSVSCETNSDNDLLNNRLPKVEYLLCEIKSSLGGVASWKDDTRYSAQKCGQHAYLAIKNDIEESLYRLDLDDAIKICKEFIEFNKGCDAS